MTDKNPDEMTATCSVCGPTKMRKVGKGFQCEVAYQQTGERYRAKRLETQTAEEADAARERKRDYMRGYYQEHKEEYRNNTRRWRAENPERKSELDRAFYDAHRDDPKFQKANREKTRRYYDAHKDDPEFQKANREKGRRYYDRHKDDPKFRERANETWRRNYHKRKAADDG